MSKDLGSNNSIVVHISIERTNAVWTAVFKAGKFGRSWDLGFEL